jgi:hypothetical protein
MSSTLYVTHVTLNKRHSRRFRSKKLIMSTKQAKSSKGAKQHNPLLVKGDVGKIRPTVYDLPGDDHVYGKAVIRDPLECAANGNQSD